MQAAPSVTLTSSIFLSEGILPSSADLRRAVVSYCEKNEAVLTSTHNLCFERKREKNIDFLPENCHFYCYKNSILLNGHY